MFYVKRLLKCHPSVGRSDGEVSKQRIQMWRVSTVDEGGITVSCLASPEYFIRMLVIMQLAKEPWKLATWRLDYCNYFPWKRSGENTSLTVEGFLINIGCACEHYYLVPTYLAVELILYCSTYNNVASQVLSTDKGQFCLTRAERREKRNIPTSSSTCTLTTNVLSLLNIKYERQSVRT